MPRPPQRIVIHAGFHKTGTSTVQATLRQNGPVLWPVMAMGLPPKIRPILSAARGFSTWRDPLALVKFSFRFGEWVRALKLKPRRQLLICSEELSGHLPGRGDLADYSAAPELARTMADELEEAFGDRLQLTFLYSLRRPAAWLQSAYWEHVKSSRMTLSLDDFTTRYAGAADLPAIVDQIRSAVAPHTVTTHWLEDSAGLPLGPATPLLNLVDLDEERRAALTPGPRMNVMPDRPLLEQMLDINRSTLPDEEARAAKQALLGTL